MLSNCGAREDSWESLGQQGDETNPKENQSWIFILFCEVAQSCLTLCNPMDCSLPGFSVHGILQARILEWVTISFSRGSSRPRDWTRVSCIGGRCFNLWATREALILKYFGYLMWRFNSLEKILMLGKTEGRRRREQQRMRWFGWHHQLNGHEFEQALGDGEGQGNLVCCSPWGCKESDMTEQLNTNNNLALRHMRWLDASQPLREPDPALDLLPGAPPGELSPGWPASLMLASG